MPPECRSVWEPVRLTVCLVDHLRDVAELEDRAVGPTDTGDRGGIGKILADVTSDEGGIYVQVDHSIWISASPNSAQRGSSGRDRLRIVRIERSQHLLDRGGGVEIVVSEEVSPSLGSSHGHSGSAPRDLSHATRHSGTLARKRSEVPSPSGSLRTVAVTDSSRIRIPGGHHPLEHTFRESGVDRQAFTVLPLRPEDRDDTPIGRSSTAGARHSNPKVDRNVTCNALFDEGQLVTACGKRRTFRVPEHVLGEDWSERVRCGRDCLRGLLEPYAPLLGTSEKPVIGLQLHCRPTREQFLGLCSGVPHARRRCLRSSQPLRKGHSFTAPSAYR